MKNDESLNDDDDSANDSCGVKLKLKKNINGGEAVHLVFSHLWFLFLFIY